MKAIIPRMLHELLVSDTARVSYSYWRATEEKRTIAEESCFYHYINTEAAAGYQGRILEIHAYDCYGTEKPIYCTYRTYSHYNSIVSFKFISPQNIEIVSKLFAEFNSKFYFRKEKGGITTLVIINKNYKKGDIIKKSDKIFFSSIARLLFETYYSIIPFYMRRLLKKNKNLSYFKAYQLAYSYEAYFSPVFGGGHSPIRREGIYLISRYGKPKIQFSIPIIYTAKEFTEKFLNRNREVSSYTEEETINIEIDNPSKELEDFFKTTKGFGSKEGKKFLPELYDALIKKHEEITTIRRFAI